MLASLGQELLELLQAVLAEGFLEVILNYGYLELTGQPILQIVERGPIEPQQIFLLLSPPLGVLEDLVAADPVEPLQHPQVDHLRAAEVQHRLLQASHSQVRQQLSEVGNVGSWLAADYRFALEEVEELRGSVLRQRCEEGGHEFGVLDGRARDFVLGRKVLEPELGKREG